MAGLEGAHADEGYANTGGPKDGPVLTMMSKRLRALRKKFNRILQIEENKAQGKTVNKEQEDVLRTKIAVAALIDEYEKLRQPLLVAVKEEVTEREKELLAASLEREEEEVSVAEDDADGAAAPSPEVAAKDIAAAEKEGDVEAEHAAANAVAEGEEEAAAAPDLAEPPQVQANGLANGEPREAADAAVSESPAEDHEDDSSSTGQAATMADSQIVDLLTLLYFAQMFDMRSPGEAPSYVWTKVHERNSCLSYDLIKDDVTTPLVESDLEALAVFGSLLTTRPPNVTLSHRDALEKCVDHARSWLATSDSSIGDFYPQLPISYSGLREKLNRILGSEYFIMTPEMRTVSQQTAAAAAAATAAGQFVPKVLPPPVMGTMAGEVVIDDSVYLQDGPAPAQFYPGREFVPAVPLVVANGIPVPSPLMAVANSVPFVPEHLGATIDVPQHGSHDEESQDSPDTDAIPEPEQENTQSVPIQQPQPQNQGYYGGGPRAGGYSNPRGRMGYQGGRGRGGFPTGRGGRGGRGGFQGGSRSDRGFYDQGGQGNQGGQGGFYPRNQNYYGGRGGRGPRNYYNNHSNGPAPPQQAAPPPQAVAAGTA